MSYRGTTQLAQRNVHVYQLKPRKRRVGLFRGRIFLDASTGDLVRAEGSIVKTPSFWVKTVQFVQDYVNVDGFTLVQHAHLAANVRLVGRAVIDVFDFDYTVIPVPPSVQEGFRGGGPH